MPEQEQLPEDQEPELLETRDDNQGRELQEMELPDWELPEGDCQQLGGRGLKRHPTPSSSYIDDVTFTYNVSVHRISIMEDMVRDFMASGVRRDAYTCF